MILIDSQRDGLSCPSGDASKIGDNFEKKWQARRNTTAAWCFLMGLCISAGHKAFIELEYAKPDPNLHSQLFAKRPGWVPQSSPRETLDGNAKFRKKGGIWKLRKLGWTHHSRLCFRSVCIAFEPWSLYDPTVGCIGNLRCWGILGTTLSLRRAKHTGCRSQPMEIWTQLSC